MLGTGLTIAILTLALLVGRSLPFFGGLIAMLPVKALGVMIGLDPADGRVGRGLLIGSIGTTLALTVYVLMAPRLGRWAIPAFLLTWILLVALGAIRAR